LVHTKEKTRTLKGKAIKRRKGDQKRNLRKKQTHSGNSYTRAVTCFIVDVRGIERYLQNDTAPSMRPQLSLRSTRFHIQDE
jgi:hypothetical protein